MNENEGSDLALGSDHSIQTCTGRFENGAIFEFRDGKPFVRGASAPDFVEGTPTEIEQIKAALEAKFGKRRIKLEASGRFILLNTPEKSDAQKAVDALRGAAAKRLHEALGTDVKKARDYGLVSIARRLLEDEKKPTSEVLGDLQALFNGIPEIGELSKIALREAANQKGNQQEAAKIVKENNLVAVVRARLGKGETEADIRTALMEDVSPYENPDGLSIECSKAEIEEIVNLAMVEGKMLYDKRKREKPEALRKKGREKGMVTSIRLHEASGFTDAEIRDSVALEYAGLENFEDHFDAALLTSRDATANKTYAEQEAIRLKLPPRIASDLRKGIDPARIWSFFEAEVIFLNHGRGQTRRSDAEAKEIKEEAFRLARSINAKEKTDKTALVSRAHEIGMVIRAGYLLRENGLAVARVIQDLRNEFTGEDHLAPMIDAAIEASQDDQKVYWANYKRLEADRMGNHVLAQRRGGLDGAAIEADLRARYAQYTGPSGNKFQRGNHELTQIVAAANAMADALENQEKVTADLVRRKKVLKANVKQFLPFTAERKWDASMRANGAFRLARLRSEEGRTPEEVRKEVERLFGGEDDPEAMAAYVLSRVSNSKFNADQAVLTATEKAYDRAARRQVDAGQNDGQIEAALIPTVKTADMSTAEARDIVRAAIQLARAEKKWEGQKETAIKTAWEVTKGAVVGAGALALTAASAAVLGTAFGLKKLWGGIKKAAPYAWPVTKTVGVGVAKGLWGTVKLARNALIYAPATAIWTPLKRTYEGLRAAKNYPKPPHYHMKDKWWKKPGQWMANGARGLWWRSKQAVALAAALPLAFTLGAGEGIAKGIGHNVLGTEWNGSETVDHFMHHYEHPQPIQISGPSASAAAAAPAAGGDHGGHGGH